MNYLRRILWKDHSRTHLLFAFTGTLAGFVLLLAGIQFYTDLRGVLAENRDLLDPEYIVINKKVNIGQTLGLSANGFSEAELQELAAQDFSERVAPFISNQFRVSGYTQNERFPDFYTELFFEAIPDDFVDVKSDQWEWEMEEDIIPLIIPQDYLNLYNFGFAPSQGLPQIPKEVLSLIRFHLRLHYADGSFDDYDGRIVGFSNRIHSILVPHDFLEWANEKYGYFKESLPSQVILVSNDPTNPEIISYLENKGYDTIREKLKSSRMNVILKFVLSFLLIVATLIIALAFLVFLLSLQLMISRSSAKIIRLNKLGFHFREIGRPYVGLLLLLMGGITGLSLLITSLLARKFSQMAEAWSLEIASSLHAQIFILAFGLIALITLSNILAIRISTKKLCQ